LRSSPDTKREALTATFITAWAFSIVTFAEASQWHVGDLCNIRRPYRMSCKSVSKNAPRLAFGIELALGDVIGEWVRDPRQKVQRHQAATKDGGWRKPIGR
jgi:hypothetical protein